MNHILKISQQATTSQLPSQQPMQTQLQRQPQPSPSSLPTIQTERTSETSNGPPQPQSDSLPNEPNQAVGLPEDHKDEGKTGGQESDTSAQPVKISVEAVPEVDSL